MGATYESASDIVTNLVHVGPRTPSHIASLFGMRVGPLHQEQCGRERKNEFHDEALACPATTKRSRLHVVFTLLLVKLALLLGCGVLVLLVLRDKVIHVGLGLCEFHFVHAFSRVPMKEGLAAEHRSEVLCHALEHLLDRCGVACK